VWSVNVNVVSLVCKKKKSTHKQQIKKKTESFLYRRIRRH
jgi:hypothetical protein